jgi:tetratricopeptide (TPR) repeat protein
MLGLCGWRSTEQVQLWRDTLTLFTHTLQISPRSALAHEKLGAVLLKQKRYSEAIEHYTEALRFHPPFAAEIHNNLGVALYAQGKDAEAITHYTRALLLRPDWGPASINLGIAISRQQRGASQEQFFHDLP